MLMTLSPLQWGSLAGALILFLGPGYGLFSFYRRRNSFDTTQTVTISLGLSMAFWAVLLAWLQAFRIPISPAGAFAILAFGWAVGLIRSRPWTRFARSASAQPIPFDLSRVVLWASLVLTSAAGLWALRGIVAGPGSDSYHHTLIVQMIAERGMLPNDYAPYAPLVTFMYHFGFHGIAAAMMWLTGLKAITLVPVLAQVLMAAAALSVSFFAQATTGSRWAAAVSASIAGLVSVFPAYYINWGRYTQLTGLVLLPIFLGLVWHWAELSWNRSLAPFVGVLAAGIALAHYRVTLMAAAGVAVLIGLNGLVSRIGWSGWRQTAERLALSAAIAGVLCAPWAWHVIAAFQTGYPIEVDKPGPTYFVLDRLGASVLNYPTNWVVIGLALVAILVGWWRRALIVAGLLMWAAVMLFLSTPRFAGAFMDTISVFISLYFPVAVVIGWGTVTIVEWLAVRWKWMRWVACIGLVGVSLWGAVNISSIVEPASAYVGPDDLMAMEWIQSHTPPSARFMVNTYHWDYMPNYVIGSDAGYWLPLLAGRATVTAPMTYPTERSTWPGFASRLGALDRLGGHLTSPEALKLLQREGITLVYIGERGGPIAVNELLESPAFGLEYQNGSVFVFSLSSEESP